MGASTSRMEEDKALHLCSERKKYVKHALDGRCSLAASHVTYIQSLRSVGIAFHKFVGPEAPIESSLCTSTSATPELLSLNGKSVSHFSFHSPTPGRVDVAENFSPSPSPPYSTQFQANHMRFTSGFSKKIEEKPSLPVTGFVTSSSASQNNTPRSSKIPHSETSPSPADCLSNGNHMRFTSGFSKKIEEKPSLPVTSSSASQNNTPRSSKIPHSETSPSPADCLSNGNTPWDYFSILDPSESQPSFQEGANEQLGNPEDIRKHREEGIWELEDEEHVNNSDSLTEESEESEDEFDEPSADTLVRSFENLNRASDNIEASVSSPVPSAEKASPETELLKHKKSRSFKMSPLHDTPTATAVPTDTDRAPVQADVAENKVPTEDFFASMKYIQELFLRASESGEEVSRMLEANKLHFRPIVPSRKGRSETSTILTTCFSCGEDSNSIPKEPPQTATKHSTWHRTTSSHSSPPRNPLGSASKDDTEYLKSDPFENFCMISGSHASTLDRLYAWERKLYDEIKASKMVRSKYDMKCKSLRELESKGASSYHIDKTRAIVKDLHSGIRVAIHRIDHISKKIEDLRDKELQPQLEELIKGLSHMWREMSNFHKLQHDAISVTHSNGSIRISICSQSHQHITLRLDNELGSLSSSLMKWIGAQKSYLQAINGWLLKCVTLPQKSSKRRSRARLPSWRVCGPPIYVTCGEWSDKLNELPANDVVESMKGLAADASHFLPCQEKVRGKKMGNTRSDGSDPAVGILRDEALEDCTLGLDRFRSSLVGFFGQLSKFADSSKRMYEDLENKTEKAKNDYEQWKNYVKTQS